MNPQDNLDRIIDRALSEYRNAEPLGGMENRILRRIAAQPESRTRGWTWVLAAAAVTAVIVAALWLGVREHPRQPSVATNETRPAQQTMTSTARVETSAVPSAELHPDRSARATSNRPSSTTTPRIVGAAVGKPALKRFPTPAPMTTEEHALLALARTHPDALLAQPDGADQLTIAPIDIKPLAPEAEAPQGEQ